MHISSLVAYTCAVCAESAKTAKSLDIFKLFSALKYLMDFFNSFPILPFPVQPSMKIIYFRGYAVKMYFNAFSSIPLSLIIEML